jgi:hypothetical protein
MFKTLCSILSTAESKAKNEKNPKLPTKIHIICKQVCLPMNHTGPLHNLLTNLKRREIMIDQKREASHRNHQKLHSEGVVISVIGCLKFHVDQVHCGVGTGNVDELKQRKSPSY